MFGIKTIITKSDEETIYYNISNDTLNSVGVEKKDQKLKNFTSEIKVSLLRNFNEQNIINNLICITTFNDVESNENIIDIIKNNLLDNITDIIISNKHSDINIDNVNVHYSEFLSENRVIYLDGNYNDGLIKPQLYYLLKNYDNDKFEIVNLGFFSKNYAININ